jgi:hypothetical protein
VHFVNGGRIDGSALTLRTAEVRNVNAAAGDTTPLTLRTGPTCQPPYPAGS